MYEEYRNRMSKRGTYMGDTMRKQTKIVVDALWMNSVSTLPVCVKAVDKGLPPTYNSVEDFNEVIYAHFEPNKKYNVGGNEVDYYLTFQPQVVDNHSEIKVGSYVSIPNIHNKPEYWLMVHIAEDNGLIKCQILKCNWILKWISNNKIYNCLSVLRNGSNSLREVENAGLISSVDGTNGLWCPTNKDTQTIGYNTRFLISDEGRIPPLAWKVYSIKDTLPVGLTRLGFDQDKFNPERDNAELGVADYYVSPIKPEPPSTETGTATIIYSGTKPTIKVGGSYKTFSATFSDEDVSPKSWSISDENGVVISDMEDYTIEYDGDKLKLKVGLNYYLIGKVLTIKVIGTDDSIAELKIEIIG